MQQPGDVNKFASSFQFSALLAFLFFLSEAEPPHGHSWQQAGTGASLITYCRRQGKHPPNYRIKDAHSVGTNKSHQVYSVCSSSFRLIKILPQGFGWKGYTKKRLSLRKHDRGKLKLNGNQITSSTSHVKILSNNHKHRVYCDFVIQYILSIHCFIKYFNCILKYQSLFEYYQENSDFPIKFYYILEPF